VICLRCGKTTIVGYRDNCGACLTAVRREIKAGLTTDAIEVQAGRRSPSAAKEGRRQWFGRKRVKGG